MQLKPTRLPLNMAFIAIVAPYVTIKDMKWKIL
jgi:hypothetical protein